MHFKHYSEDVQAHLRGREVAQSLHRFHQDRLKTTRKAHVRTVGGRTPLAVVSLAEQTQTQTVAYTRIRFYESVRILQFVFLHKQAEARAVALQQAQLNGSACVGVAAWASPSVRPRSYTQKSTPSGRRGGVTPRTSMAVGPRTPPLPSQSSSV